MKNADGPSTSMHGRLFNAYDVKRLAFVSAVSCGASNRPMRLLKAKTDATLRRKNALDLERLMTVIWLDVCTSCDGASVKLIEQAVLRPSLVQSRRTVAPMRKARPKEWSWAHLE